MSAPTDPPRVSVLADPVKAWMARGRELNALYDALYDQVGRSPTGDPVADIRALGAERDRYREALELVARRAEDAAVGKRLLAPYPVVVVARAALGERQPDA